MNKNQALILVVFSLFIASAWCDEPSFDGTIELAFDDEIEFPVTSNWKTCCSTLKSRPQQHYTYHQSSGKLVGGSGQWAINTVGYSGSTKGRNKPSMQCISNTGPAPAGQYKLGGCTDVMHGSTPRPCSFYMTPLDNSKMCGRSGIMLHGCQCGTNGDHTAPPTAGCSAGCVVINRDNRMKLRVGDIITVVHD